MIREFLDTILPGDSRSNMPAGSSINLARYVDRQKVVTDLFGEFLLLLDNTAKTQMGTSFVELDEDRRAECVETVKRLNARLSAAIIVHALKAYYTDEAVLRALSSDSVPPFPAGNSLAEDDWSILEPVYERGPIFRSARS